MLDALSLKFSVQVHKDKLFVRENTRILNIMDFVSLIESVLAFADLNEVFVSLFVLLADFPFFFKRTIFNKQNI